MRHLQASYAGNLRYHLRGFVSRKSIPLISSVSYSWLIVTRLSHPGNVDLLPGARRSLLASGQRKRPFCNPGSPATGPRRWGGIVSRTPTGLFHPTTILSAACASHWQKEINDRSEDRTQAGRAPFHTDPETPCAYRSRPQLQKPWSISPVNLRG